MCIRDRREGVLTVGHGLRLLIATIIQSFFYSTASRGVVIRSDVVDFGWTCTCDRSGHLYVAHVLHILHIILYAFLIMAILC